MKPKKISIADLAENREKHLKGLMWVTHLPRYSGMLFDILKCNTDWYKQHDMVFDEFIEQGLWMRNTLLPLDGIFITPENKISAIANMQPYSTKVHKSKAPCAFILEVNAGVCEELSIKVGDEFVFDRANNIVEFKD